MYALPVKLALPVSVTSAKLAIFIDLLLAGINVSCEE
jgi:hypothetical protein